MVKWFEIEDVLQITQHIFGAQKLKSDSPSSEKTIAELETLNIVVVLSSRPAKMLCW